MGAVVVIDSALLAIPNYANSSKGVEALFNNINDWASATEHQNCCRIAISSKTVDVLGAANCFPATHNIRALLEILDLQGVFSPEDINSRIFSLLSRAETLQDIFGFEATEVNSVASPEIDFSSSPSPDLTNNSHCVMATILMSTEPSLIRLVSGFPTPSWISHFEAEVSTTIGEQGIISFSPSKHVDGNIRVVNTPAEFLQSLDGNNLWETADHPIQIHLAISLEIARIANHKPPFLPLDFGTPFCVSADFHASLQMSQAAGMGPFSKVVLERCAQVILGTGQRRIADFGGGRPTDNASGHRVHVTSSHQALRLMFWRRPSGTIELANIGNKKQLLISPGDCTQTFAARFGKGKK